MNKPALVVALAAFLFSTGCSNNSSPEAVLRSFLDKMEEKKYDDAARLATKNSQDIFKEIKEKDAYVKEKYKGQVPEETIYDDTQTKKREFEVGKAKITGNLATIPVTYKHENGTTVLKWGVEKEDGKWKVMLRPYARPIYRSEQ